jgi:cation:H+ antiporter
MLLFLLAFDGLVTRTEGLVLITVYVIYVVALMNGENVPEEEPGQWAGGGASSWLLLLGGLGIVIISSETTVRSVVNIAFTFEISEALISVLIIGLGSSLPELSISISAILKKKTQMTVGNIIGSNILDTLLPIGIAAVISQMTFERQLLFFDLPFIFVLTLVVLAFFYTKRGVTRPEGVVILGLYFAYVIVKLLQF